MTLALREARYAAGGRTLLQATSLDLAPGRVHALLGPNGAGKSTLLRLLAGELAPGGGEAVLDRRALALWPARALAARRAVLPQRDGLQFPFRVHDVVALGRLPVSDARDAAVVDETLAAADATHLADRLYTTLSGGERARVQMARVLAQVWTPAPGAANYLLLDEPTASLDLAHQHACLKLARSMAAARGCGVLLVLHDPNLALRYADEVSLLREGRVIASGAARELLTADRLGALYGLPLRALDGGLLVAG